MTHAFFDHRMASVSSSSVSGRSRVGHVRGCWRCVCVWCLCLRMPLLAACVVADCCFRFVPVRDVTGLCSLSPRAFGPARQNCAPAVCSHRQVAPSRKSEFEQVVLDLVCPSRLGKKRCLPWPAFISMSGEPKGIWETGGSLWPRAWPVPGSGPVTVSAGRCRL